MEYNKTYLLFADDFFYFLDNNTRKSIPLSYFEEKAHIILEKYSPRLDYLKIVKEYMEVKYGKEK